MDRSDMHVVVTGATGFIGTALVPALLARGRRVTVLTRDPARAAAAFGASVNVVRADLETPGPWGEALAGADAIVHLAGESIGGKRWDARQKQVLRDSRVEATRTLVEQIGAIAEAERPDALIAASGVDYYPFASDENDFDDDEVTEAAPSGETFLGRLCRDWEKEAMAAEALGVRVACMRTGVVLGKGGAVEKMSAPFKMFAGGKIGSGRQFLSWVHRDDVVAAYVAATGDARFRGPINLVTASTRAADFAKALGARLGHKAWLPVPGFAVKAAAGELAEYLLHGRNAVPAKLNELGFEFAKPTLEAALEDV